MPTATKRARVSSDYQLLPVEDLSGGIDLRRSPSLMQPNRARSLLNWSLEEPGALIVFPGWAAFSSTSLGSGRAQGGQRIYLSGTTFSLAAWSGSVYKPSDAGVWGSAVLAGLHATNDIFFPYDRDMVAALDASAVPKKSTDGTTWTQMGISKPLAAPVLSAVAGGALINGDTYEVSYSYQDDELTAEGNESTTATQAAGGGNLTVRVAVIASTDPQVDKINVYVRDTTIGESVRRRYTQVSNTNQNVDITANTWETAVEAPSDHDVPEAMAFGVVWKNRWWMRHATHKTRLYFSQIFQPQSVPALFYIDIPFERGDEITAVIAQGDTLVVFGQSSKPFLIIGQTSLDFEVRPAAGGEAGALGARAVETIENGVLHVAAEGVYIFDGATDRLLSYDIDPGWQDLIHGSSSSDLSKVACIYHPARKEVRVAVPRLYPFGTAGEWVLDLNRTRLQSSAAWTATDRTIGGYLLWRGNESVTGNRGRLFSWSNTIGKLFEEATGTTANGSDLSAQYTGPTLTTGLYSARIIDGYVEFEPNAGSFSVETLIDGVSMGSDNIDITGGQDEYGTGLYGTATYSGGNRDMKPFTLPLESEGRSVLMKTAYLGQATFRHYTYAYGISPETAPRGL
jgi:hypothetical protein